MAESPSPNRVMGVSRTTYASGLMSSVRLWVISSPFWMFPSTGISCSHHLCCPVWKREMSVTPAVRTPAHLSLRIQRCLSANLMRQSGQISAGTATLHALTFLQQSRLTAQTGKSMARTFLFSEKINGLSFLSDRCNVEHAEEILCQLTTCGRKTQE